MRLIGLELPIPEEKWPALLGETLHRNHLTDASIRISISRGEGAIRTRPILVSAPDHCDHGQIDYALFTIFKK